MFKDLLYPKTVAVVGVSHSPGKAGHEVLSNLVNGGFSGTIVPVGSSGAKVAGLHCYKDLSEFRGEIDLGILVVPAAGCRKAAKDCIEAGAKALVAITAGFREVGDAGAAAELELLELCRRHSVRLLGPNCSGVLNTRNRLNATVTAAVPPPGGMGIMAQSGALTVAMLDWCTTHRIGVSRVVSLGNKADVNEVDCLRAFAEDEETKVVVGYLENIVDGVRFLQVAEQCAAAKPVVLLKAGITTAGARAAAAHTGCLAGTDVAYTAAFRHAGVLRAETFEQLFDYALALGMQPLPAGRRVTLLTNAGAPGILAADAAEAAGLELAPPSESALAQLRGCLPANAPLANPVDLIGDAEPERFHAAFRILQEDANTDALVVMATPQYRTQPLRLAEALAAAHRHSKPVLAAWMGGREMEEARACLAAAGIPSYPSPERAVHALKVMCEHAAWKNRPTRVVVHFPVNRRRVDRILRKYSRMRRPQIPEVEAKDVLDAYGFRVLPSALATTVDEAQEAANRIGYPVVLKIFSPDIVHKSDIGGVIVNLATAEQVADAWDLILSRARRHAPDARIQGVYVERMGRRGREVILGLHRDPQFGPLLMFGLGGIFVEALKDVAFQLAPITAAEAMEMLKLTRSYSLLAGARGQRPVDMHAIAEALQRISQLSTDYPQITDLDINPFIVGEVGSEAYAADARITLRVPED